MIFIFQHWFSFSQNEAHIHACSHFEVVRNDLHFPKIKNGLVQIFAHGFDFFHYKAFTVVIAFLTSDESGSLADVLEILV